MSQRSAATVHESNTSQPESEGYRRMSMRFDAHLREEVAKLKRAKLKRGKSLDELTSSIAGPV